MYLQVRCDVSALQFAADVATQHSTAHKGHLSKRETAVSRAEEPSPAQPSSAQLRVGSIMTRIKSVCRPLSAFVWPFKLVRLAKGSRAVPD